MKSILYLVSDNDVCCPTESFARYCNDVYTTLLLSLVEMYNCYSACFCLVFEILYLVFMVVYFGILDYVAMMCMHTTVS